jgi:mRNA interferase YafQ
MRTISRSTKFKKDLKRESRSGLAQSFLTPMTALLELLVLDLPLPQRLRDHALGGNWDGHRDCHIRPDLVLIYRKVGDDTLELVRLGSHSELDL